MFSKWMYFTMLLHFHVFKLFDHKDKTFKFLISMVLFHYYIIILLLWLIPLGCNSLNTKCFLYIQQDSWIGLLVIGPPLLAPIFQFFIITKCIFRFSISISTIWSNCFIKFLVIAPIHHDCYVMHYYILSHPNYH